MKPEDSQQPTIGTYPDRNESSPNRLKPLRSDSFYHYLSTHVTTYN